MIKLLLGGSPCTYWSIAQTKNRETKPSGLGWELFENYLIAKEKFRPDFYLYENNVSAAAEIKSEIKSRFGVGFSDARYIEINSALVSAQNRRRFYVHNCGDVGQPADRGIVLRDVLESGLPMGEKSYALTASYNGAVAWNTLKRKQRTMVAEPVFVNYTVIDGCRLKDMGNKLRQYDKSGTKQGKYVYKESAAKIDTCTAGQTHNLKIIVPVRIGTIENNAQRSEYDSKQYRVYSCDGKSTALCGQGGGLGAKTGLYATPANDSGRTYPVYEVKDGYLDINGEEYPVKLQDGKYIIRKLTVTECCRLQTLPDDYCRAISKTQAYKCLGNGWTAEVIIHILSGALKNVPRGEHICVLSMYDGIGTGRYCLDKMGFTNVEYHAYEIDKYAIQVAKSNYPDIIEHGDAYAVRKSGNFNF